MIAHAIKISMFRVSNGLAGINRSSLVPADAPRQDLVLGGCGVEVPLAGLVLRQRHRKNIIVRSNLEHLTASLDLSPTVHLVVSRNKILQIVFVLGGVPGEDDLGC